MEFETLELSNLTVSVADGVALVRLSRPEKRNALDLATIEQLITLMNAISRSEVRAVVLAAAGDHFSAGLDLVEHHKQDRSASDFMRVCLRWHEAFNKMEYGGIPIIAALKGAVVGGGLELASAAHIRIADQTTYFALPEGQRGLFTGGGATIRVAGLVGKARMIDMMLTGRVYKAEEAMSIGLCQYVVENSEAKAMEVALRAAKNPPLSNFAICSAISHVQNMSGFDASYTESMVAGMVNTQPASRQLLAAFADKSGARIRPE